MKDGKMRLADEGAGRLRKCLGACGRALTFALLTSVLFLILAVRPAERAEVDFLDVGQGDGIYLCTSDGTNVFIDGGSSDVSGVGTYRILPFLKYRGIRKIDYWFVSHSDMDHVSGLKELLTDGYPVGNLVLAQAAADEEKTAALAELAAASGTAVCYMQTADSLVTESASIQCLAPAADDKNEDVNELSLVLLLEDGDFRGIFTGDISAEAERRLLADQGPGAVDLYKAAHHGSKHSNSFEFLQELKPETAVVSCGAGNRYGHPGEEALCNMEEAGAKVYLTMEGGRIRVRYGGEGMIVEAYREEGM